MLGSIIWKCLRSPGLLVSDIVSSERIDVVLLLATGWVVAGPSLGEGGAQEDTCAGSWLKQNAQAHSQSVCPSLYLSY